MAKKSSIKPNQNLRFPVRQVFLTALCALFLIPAGFSQEPFPEPGPVFRDDLMPRIRLYLPQDSLDKMYRNPESDHEMRTLFVFESGTVRDTLPGVGIRFRGNTSRQSAKKSIKISFNTFNARQSFFGLEKMNLNGEHNDPSVIRSKLCWDLCRSFGIPAPRSNHILLYINDKFWGVYINVEQVDEEFAGLRFGNKKGNLYKCLYPADLTFRSKNPDYYKFSNDGRRAYTLKTNETADDYSDLARFIDVLNNTPINSLQTEIEPLININTLLRIMVLDVFTGNWDGPFFNKNNFYLYRNTATGRFEQVPYDLDNTFGIDWFGIEWAIRNVYEWSPPMEPRPLYTRILSVPAYRKEYTRLFYELINSMADGNFIKKIERIRNMCTPYISADPFYRRDYGWTPENYLTSFNSPLEGSHVKSGLIPYINLRISTARIQLDAISSTDPIGMTDPVRIYPNPAREIVNVEMDDPTADYEIFSTGGSLAGKGTLTRSCTSINSNNLVNGIYYLVIKRDGRATINSRIVIIH
jgi:hypothetical protein